MPCCRPSLTHAWLAGTADCSLRPPCSRLTTSLWLFHRTKGNRCSWGQKGTEQPGQLGTQAGSLYFAFPSLSMARADAPPPPSAETSTCGGWVSPEHHPWMSAWVGGECSGRKTNNGWGVGGSRQQMLAGGLVRDRTVSWCPLDPGLARDAPGDLLHHLVQLSLARWPQPVLYCPRGARILPPRLFVSSIHAFG